MFKPALLAHSAPFPDVRVIRWMILCGFLVFALGILLSTYFNNERIGFSLSIAGFALALLGIVGGNWIAASKVGVQSYANAHRIAVVGFLIAVVGILLGEFFSGIGSYVMAGGLGVMFLGFIVAVWAINRRGEIK